jgi:hypothetical protein
MKNKLLNLVEEINHKINKTEIQEDEGQGSEIMKALGENFPYAIGDAISDILDKKFAYRGNMMSYMNGEGMIVKLESPNLLDYLKVIIRFVPSKQLYDVSIVLDYMAGTVNEKYKVFCMDSLTHDQLPHIIEHLMTHRTEVKKNYDAMYVDKRINHKSKIDSMEILNQTYDDKLRKIKKTEVNAWKESN